MGLDWKNGIITLFKRCTILFKGYTYCIQHLRRNKLIFRYIFHFRPYIPADSYWDWTTLVLKKAIQKYMENHFCMMDVGTGVVGVLALYTKYLFPQARIFGVDQFDFIVASARGCALKNNLPVNFIVGDLLNGVHAQFNLITFNPPYIDERTNEHLRILDNSISYKKCSGGSDGCRTINRFLISMSDYLAEEGLVLLGANEFYVPREKIKHMVSQNSLKVIEILGNNFTMSYVFVIGK